MTALRAALIAALAAMWLPVAALAQQDTVTISAILTIESDRMFSDSLFGRRVAQEIEAAQSVLLAENRRIEAELSAEEKALTEKRKEMSAEDFRAVADAFDTRVEEFRQLQDSKAGEIAEMQEAEEAAFVQAARPILADLMQLGVEQQHLLHFDNTSLTALEQGKRGMVLQLSNCTAHLGERAVFP